MALALLVLSSTLTLFPGTAYACDCAEGPPLEEVADKVHTVFVGRQLSREILAEPARSDSRGTWDVALTFEVLDVYRGEVTNPMVVYTGEDSCGVDYDGRGITGVLAYDVGDIPTVRSCRPFRADRATIKQLFGEPSEPLPVVEEPDPIDEVGLPEPIDESGGSLPPWLWLLVPASLGSLAAVAAVAKKSRAVDA